MWLNTSEFPKKKIEQIDIPVLILTGDRDAAIPIKESVRMYKLIPNAELAIIPEADHDVYETKPDLFNSIVLEFLMRHK